MDDEQIFLQAVELNTRADRVAFLDVACGNDHRLRANVESLLKHHALAGQFLECPPSELQKTFAAGQAETVENDTSDRTLEWLASGEEPGQVRMLGPYELLDVIGRGGMGIVFRGRDPKLDRLVAIKVLATRGDPGPDSVKRFCREAQAAAAVKHDHVVAVHAIHDEGPLPYLVMDLVEGISLQQKIDGSGRLELSEILRIGSQIAAGLEAAHKRGLVHRDIKPSNILLEAGTGRVKIADFGLARAVDDGSLSREGQFAGTPQFMSPEQAQGRKSDHRSDLFSLGGVLYMMCTGRPAFPAESALAALRGVCDDTVRPIRETNPNVPEWLEEIVCRLLEKDPGQRPQSASEVAELLGRRLAVHRAVPPRRRRWIPAALAAAAPLLLTGVILIVVSGSGKKTRVEIPDGASVTVGAAGDVTVSLPPGAEKSSVPSANQSIPPRVREVVTRLAQLNPGFDGQVTPGISNGELIELQLNVDHVKDLSPLQGLTTLRSLVCTGSARGSSQLSNLSPLRGAALESLDLTNTQVTDLTPLKGMPLRRLTLNGTLVADLQPLAAMSLKSLNCANTAVSDLSPLKAMPLTELFVQGTQVADLSSLRGMPLQHLNYSFTRVTDVAPLQGLALKSLFCEGTNVADLSPLAGMPLVTLHWRGYDQTDPRHQKVVRSIGTLETIDSLPAAEFWQKTAPGQ